MEMEELLTDAGFALVISGLLAATFTFPYVGNCGEAAYYDLHKGDCDLYPPMFYGGVAVGAVGFLMVGVGVLGARRSKGPPPEKEDWTSSSRPAHAKESKSKK
ncbi:MAG: hypothetical protein KAU99_06185 [Thermoplasmata archaeon]|nr:hypothetical protein [Thermoplasmata archaeon]